MFVYDLHSDARKQLLVRVVGVLDQIYGYGAVVQIVGKVIFGFRLSEHLNVDRVDRTFR